RQVYSLLT
ncbi:Replicative DNA helicase, partial [Haemophilus influenzae]